jgi:hypothetical protein
MTDCRTSQLRSQPNDDAFGISSKIIFDMYYFVRKTLVGVVPRIVKPFENLRFGSFISNSEAYVKRILIYESIIVLGLTNFPEQKYKQY